MAKKKTEDLTPREARMARLAQSKAESKKEARMQRLGVTGVIVAIVVALIALAAFGIANEARKGKANDVLVTPTAAAISPKTFGINYTPKDAGFEGEANPVKLTLWEDFSCPACKQFEEAAGPQLNEWVADGKLTIEYRQISFLDDNGASLNEYSRRATSAALCVLEDEGIQAWKSVHDALWATQPDERTAGPSNRELFSALSDDMPKLDEACVVQGKYVPWVEKATEAFYDDPDVNATPTGVLDGKVLESNEILPAIEAAIAKSEG